MSSSRFERIGLDHLVAAVPALRAHGAEHLAHQLSDTARRFCLAAVRHRRSAAYRVRLRSPFDLGVGPLAATLLAAADVLLRGDEDAAAVASWCAVLAARLQAIAHEPDLRVSGLLVFVNVDARGLAELVLARVSDADLDRCPSLASSTQR